MAAHARLKNEFTEDEKCHNLMNWLIWLNNEDVPVLCLEFFDFIPSDMNVNILLAAYTL